MSWIISQGQGGAGRRPTTEQHNTLKVLIKLIVVDSTYALNASKAQSTLTHKHAHLTVPSEYWAHVKGRNINRHWSRHAFRDVPKAQYTFKSLLVHGILQFTMLITLRCALHRCSSRDIRRWKLCLMQRVDKATRKYEWETHMLQE